MKRFAVRSSLSLARSSLHKINETKQSLTREENNEIPFYEKTKVVVVVTPQQVGETLERGVYLTFPFSGAAGLLYSIPYSHQDSDENSLAWYRKDASTEPFAGVFRLLGDPWLKNMHIMDTIPLHDKLLFQLPADVDGLY